MARRNRSATEMIGLGFVAVMCLIGVWWGYTNILAPSLGLSGIAFPQEQAGAEDMISITKPLQISVKDKNTGAGIDGATITLYDAQNNIYETVTTDNGIATTVNSYPSGTVLYIQKNASGYVNAWDSKVVPKMSKYNAYSSEYNPIALTMVAEPDFSITLLDSSGTMIENNDTYNMASVQTATLTCTIYNTVDNSGWETSKDRIEGFNQALVVLIEAENPLVVSGPGLKVLLSNENHLVVQLQDSAVNKRVSGSSVTGGVYAFQFQINKGSLSSATASVNMSVIGYFDPQYYQSYHYGGPDTETFVALGFNVQG